LEKKRKRIQLSEATEAIAEMARTEFGTQEQLKQLRNVFEEVPWGIIEITVVDGEIENIDVKRRYKPVSEIDEDDKKR
jgi:hypothetical protein